MAPVAAKFVEEPQVHFLENGIVRSTVFPNKLRDLRRRAGYETLVDFIRETGLKEVNYIRLAKIERGQIFPRPDEVVALAKLLNVEPMSLFIDMVEKDFDRESWARDHTEASLTYRGGTREDMKIGAALRIRRQELGLSTTDLKKKFGIPAATVSRIENAERPFHRWPDKIRKSVAKMMGGTSMRDIARSVTAYEQEGHLDAMMAELFSQRSLDQRHNASLLSLVKKIPGQKAENFAAKLENMMAEKGLVDWSSKLTPVPASEQPDIFCEDRTMSVLEGKTHDGWTMLSETTTTFTRNFDGPGIAFRLDKPVLGIGIPSSALLVFELIDRSEVEGEMVLALIDGPRVRVVSARPAGRGFKLAQVNPEWQSTLSKESDVRVAKLSQIEMA